MRAALSIVPMLALALASQERLCLTADLPRRERAAVELTETLAADHDLATTVALAACSAPQLAEGSMARSRLVAALQAANLAPSTTDARTTLRAELGDLIATLRFRPLQQAELPTGFPNFGTVDEIELREYPVYRMVRTTMRGGSTGAFWPLFRHIESNGIAMTTPVQVDWQAQSDDRQRPATMAFLYGDPGITPERTADGVEVVEMPATTAISIGAVGDDRRDRVEALGERLRRWLAQHPEWQAAGPLRTMGYNSPMVPRDRRCFEVQLPVRRVEVVR